MDVDTGIDDAIALLLAVRSPELDVVAVGSVAGNVDSELAALNTLRVLEQVGADNIPVAVGSDRPLLETRESAKSVHGTDGLGEVGFPQPSGNPSGEHAVDQLIRASHEHEEQPYVVAVGPLTNIALALRKDPSLPRRLAQVIIMGGSALCGGNAREWSEANIRNDPEAASIVFQSGLPLTMVGLDVTTRARISDAEVRMLSESGDPVAKFAGRILSFRLDAYEKLTEERSCPVHDALAVAAAAQPTIVRTRSLNVQVELSGSYTRGMTVVDFRRFLFSEHAQKSANADVALDVEEPWFRQLLLNRLDFSR